VSESGHFEEALESAIAVIGMSARFPKARTVDALWENLRSGVPAVTFFTDAELAEAGIPRRLVDHPDYVKARAVLDSPELLDAKFFGLTPREAEIMDPQQRLFLECAWEALENAGYGSDKYRGRVGIYAGASANTYLLNNLYPNAQLLETVGSYQLLLANSADFMTTRVSYKLKLKGPSVCVQTACSTSLVAVHLACQSLLNGECDLALAGGVSIRIPQRMGTLYQEGGIISPDGYCRAFDARASGTVFGDGVGIVVLKRAQEAVKDGDTILALIKGSAINNDGSDKIGFTAPSVDGQADVILEALGVAQVNPETITYVEAHGTGTSLGDPIEIEALTRAFRTGTMRKEYCAIGSLKTNLGHLDAASGVAGLIKTILALQHRQIPPSLHFERPNPRIDFANSPFYVNAVLRDWQPAPDFPLRAGVSSFGIGGTNAHVVLEEAPGSISESVSRAWQVLPLSAGSASALQSATSNLAGHLVKHQDVNLADVAHTLQVGRQVFNHRQAVICRDREDAIAVLEGKVPGRLISSYGENKRLEVAFLFPGQGAQYVGMGRNLYECEPFFREQVERCTRILQPHIGFDLRDVLYPHPGKEDEAGQRLKQTALTQPALFIIEYALARFWMALGIRPTAMLGHSVGEYVAASLADVFSLEDGLALIAERGRLMQSMPKGAMLATSLKEDDTHAWLTPQISLAAVNGPRQCVFSGEPEAIDMLQKQLNGQGVECQLLATSHAYHSWMMDSVLEKFTRAVEQVRLNPPQLPFISNLTGTWIKADEVTQTSYWVRQLRSTVRFSDGLEELTRNDNRVLLEVGPGHTLVGLAKQHGGDVRTVMGLTSSQNHQNDGSEYLASTVGRLWVAGVEIDWKKYYQGERRKRVPLPTYPFERQRFWIESSGAMLNNIKSSFSTSGDDGYLEDHSSDDMSLPDAQLSSTDAMFSHLAGLVDDLFGIPISPSQKDVSFFELGLDSLALLRVHRSLQERFGVKIAIRQLFDDLSTLGKLTTYLAERPILPVPLTDVEEKAHISADDDLNGWFFAPTWKRAVDVPERSNEIDASWLLLTDHQDVGLGLAQRLAVGAQKVVSVCHATDFRIKDAQNYTISAGETTSFEQLMSHLEEQGELPDHIVHLWCLSQSDKDYLSVREVERELKMGFYSLLGLVQAWGKRKTRKPLRLTVVANGMHLVTGDEKLDPAKAAMSGCLRVIHQEYPEILCRSIDVILPETGAAFGKDFFDRLLAEVTSRSSDETVALRGRYRWLPSLDVLSFDNNSRGRKALRDRGLYLITGGLGGIGLELAKYMADEASVRLVLTGRSDFPGREEWPRWLDQSTGTDEHVRRKIQKIQEIESLGGEVILMKADVTDSQQMQAVIDKVTAHYGPICGVVHAAGVPGVGAAQTKSFALADAVLSPKIMGAIVLNDLLKDYDLDFFVLCSSINALEGGIGQFDYSSANAFLDAFALYRHSRSQKAQSLNWSSWLDVGMAARSSVDIEMNSSVDRLATRRLSPQVGVRAFASVLGSNLPQILIVPQELIGEANQQERIRIVTRLPLTEEQKQAWTIAQMGKDASLSHNGSLILKIYGALSLTAMSHAVRQVIERHEALRTSFSPAGDYQEILPVMEMGIHFTDFSNQKAVGAEIEATVAEWILSQAEQPFDLSQPPLLRCCLAKVAFDYHILILTMHHIIGDGRSLGIILEEIRQLYSAECRGETILLPVPLQFSSYLSWQNQAMYNIAMENAERYWLNQFSGKLPVLELPTDHPRPSIQTFAGGRCTIVVREPIVSTLRELSAKHDSTLFMTLFAAYQLLLAHIANQQELIIGIITSGTMPPNSEHLVGYCANLLPIRVNVDLGIAFIDHLALTREKLLDAYNHQVYPFTRLVKKINPVRGNGRPPVFTASFNLEPPAISFVGEKKFSGLEVELLDSPVASAQVDFALDVFALADTIKVRCTYNIDLFENQTISLWMKAYGELLEKIAHDPHQSTSAMCTDLCSIVMQADREEGDI
jgi:acyl transferase domain-containing protein